MSDADEDHSFVTGRLEGKMDMLLEHQKKSNEHQRDLNERIKSIESSKADRDEVVSLNARLSTVEAFRNKVVAVVTFVSLGATAITAYVIRKITGV